jgi:putative hemolysin
MKKAITFLGLVLVFAGVACDKNNPPDETGDNNTGLPNPASVFCEENGGKLEIRKDNQGNEYGVCIFANGNECDEWAYYRGECDENGPKDPGAANDNGVGIANPASTNCINKGGSLEIVDGPDGQIGMCTFPSGAKCEEWALLRGECSAQ